MNPSSSRQKLCMTFFAASAAVGVALSYLWAYHLSDPSPKFPTRWAVFRLSLDIWGAVVVVTTFLFAAPLCFVRPFSDSDALRDHRLVTLLAVLVQSAIFAAPRPSPQFNPFLLLLFLAPLLASAVFLVIRRPPTWFLR